MFKSEIRHFIVETLNHTILLNLVISYNDNNKKKTQR